MLGFQACEHALALGLLGAHPRERPLALGLRRLEALQRALVLGDVLGLRGGELCHRLVARGLGSLHALQCALVLGVALGLRAGELRLRAFAIGVALGFGGGEQRRAAVALGLGGGELRHERVVLAAARALDRGELRERLLALGVRLGDLALGFVDPSAQHVRALDEILEPRSVIEPVGAAASQRPHRGALGILRGGARGLALGGHAAADVLARQRRRVRVAHDDEDAREAGTGLGGLRAGRDDVLDGLERAVVAHPQRLGIPRVGVARAELAEQRRELPAQRQRDGHDDEAQRAPRAAATGRRKDRRRVGAPAAQQLLERRALRAVGRRREDVDDRPPGELVGGLTRDRDDADAALRDDAVGGTEDVAAVGKRQQHLLDVMVRDHGRVQLLALEAHGSPIGRDGPES